MNQRTLNWSGIPFSPMLSWTRAGINTRSFQNILRLGVQAIFFFYNAVPLQSALLWDDPYVTICGDLFITTATYVTSFPLTSPRPSPTLTPHDPGSHISVPRNTTEIWLLGGGLRSRPSWSANDALAPSQIGINTTSYHQSRFRIITPKFV
jgi:hypothetical protein